MVITISKSSEDWLREQVAAGRFASVEDALEAAVERFQQDDDLGDDDLLVHKADIDAAIAELERGEGRPADEVFQEIQERLARAR